MIKERQTKNGIRHQARVKVNGRERWESFSTRKEAESWITEIRYKRDKGITYHSKVTIDDMWNAYLDSADLKEIAPGTRYGHTTRFNKYIKPFFAGGDMTTLEVEAHEKFINWVKGQENSNQKGQKISHRTVNIIRALIKVIYSSIIAKKKFGGVFKENPYDFIEKQKENRPEIEYWNFEEASKFLEATKETKYYPLWVLILHTGLRIGEAVALDRSQFDLTSDTLAIDRTYCKQSKQVLMRPKGKITRRLGLERRQIIKKIIYPILPLSGLLFKNKFGEIINPDTLLKEVLPRYCKIAGIKDIGLHGMRHTYSAHYMMGKKDANIWDLSKELGHSSVELTNKYYGHFSNQHAQQRGSVIEFISGNVIEGNFGNQSPGVANGVV